LPDEPSLREYFDQIAGENAKQAIARFGDLRLAINAIMTLDGFFGTLHAKLHNTGTVKESSDDRWKETLAKGNKSFQVLRDMAYALKHGSLTHTKPRLVRRSDQIQRYPASFDSALFDRSAFVISAQQLRQLGDVDSDAPRPRRGNELGAVGLDTYFGIFASRVSLSLAHFGGTGAIVTCFIRNVDFLIEMSRREK